MQRQFENSMDVASKGLLQRKSNAALVTLFGKEENTGQNDANLEQELTKSAGKEKSEEDKINEMTLPLMPKLISEKSVSPLHKISGLISKKSSTGLPITKKTKNYMNQGFNRDFSTVRFHDDGIADVMCKSINAKAFTVGTNVYFAKGHFNPTTVEGKKLIAHELTHVLQQNGPKVPTLRRSKYRTRPQVSNEHPSGRRLLQRKVQVAGSNWSYGKAKRYIRKKSGKWLYSNLKNTARLLILSNLTFKFGNKSEFLQYLKRRFYMIRSMSKVNRWYGKKKCCGYPRGGGLTPRVNLSARKYWVKDRGHFEFKLKVPEGKNAADKAVANLLVPQRYKKNRTLIDCTHFVTVIQFYGLMKSLGRKKFRNMVKLNNIKVRITDPTKVAEPSSFSQAKTKGTSGVLTEVTPTSKNDYIPGDFVYFRNHPVYSALKNRVRNPPSGTTCPAPPNAKNCRPFWMGEHAIYRGKRKGKRYYQGHGIGYLTERQLINSLWKYLKCHLLWASRCNPPITTVSGYVLSTIKKSDVPGLHSSVGGPLDTIYRPLNR